MEMVKKRSLLQQPIRRSERLRATRMSQVRQNPDVYPRKGGASFPRCNKFLHCPLYPPPACSFEWAAWELVALLKVIDDQPFTVDRMTCDDAALVCKLLWGGTCRYRPPSQVKSKLLQLKSDWEFNTRLLELYPDPAYHPLLHFGGFCPLMTDVELLDKVFKKQEINDRRLLEAEDRLFLKRMEIKAEVQSRIEGGGSCSAVGSKQPSAGTSSTGSYAAADSFNHKLEAQNALDALLSLHENGLIDEKIFSFGRSHCAAFIRFAHAVNISFFRSPAELQSFLGGEFVAYEADYEPFMKRWQEEKVGC